MEMVRGADLTAYKKKRIALTVNGRSCLLKVDARDTLTDTLRQNLRLAGTKAGCRNVSHPRRSSAEGTMRIGPTGDGMLTANDALR